MSLPTYSLEVAFGIDPRTEPAPGDWVDISQWLEEGSVDRGQSSELERFQAGTLDVLLNNEDRRFEPDYKESPYYPNVELDQHVRLRAVQNAVTYNVYRGFISDWDPEWRLPNKARVTAIDAFRYFQTCILQNPYEKEVTTDEAAVYWNFNADSGAEGIVKDSSGNGLDGVFLGSPQVSEVRRGDSAIYLPGPDSAAGPRVSAGVPLISGTGPFSVEFWFRYDGVSVAGGRLFYQYDTVTGDGTYAYIYLNVVVFATHETVSKIATGTVDVLDGAWHHIVCLRETNGTLRIYVDGVQDAASSSGGIIDVVPREFQFGGISGAGSGAGALQGHLDDFAFYSTALSSTRVATHYEAHNLWDGEFSGNRVSRILDQLDWLAALRDVHTGDSILQAAYDINGESALEHLQRVEASEFGGLYVTGEGKVRFRERSGLSSSPLVTIGRDAGQLPYVEIKPDRNEAQLKNEVRFSRVGGLEQVASVSNRFFDRTFSLSNLMNVSDEEVLTLAVAVLDRDQVPRTDYAVTLNPRADDDLWDEVFGRELEDPVMVSRIPPLEPTTPQQFIWDTSEWDEDTRWGSAISRAMRILAIKHDFGKGFTWRTTWKMSPV